MYDLSHPRALCVTRGGTGDKSSGPFSAHPHIVCCADTDIYFDAPTDADVTVNVLFIVQL